MEVKVFLVDDAAKTQSALADLLNALGGFRVIGAARTEAEANLWLDEHAGKWDVAVIDLMLEQGAGLSVIARCRAQEPRGKIVVFSAYASPGVLKRCLDLGADAVFDKAGMEPLVDFFKGVAPSAQAAQ